MSERRSGLRNRRKVHTYREDDRRRDISDRRKSPTDIPHVRRHAISDRRTHSKHVAIDKRSNESDRRKSPKNDKNIYEVAESGINMVKAGLALFLLHKSEGEFDKDYTGFLVAAVINSVFDESPTNKEGRKFIKNYDNLNNVKLLIKEIERVKMLRQILTDAMRVKVFLLDDILSELSIKDCLRYCIEPIYHLDRFGLLISERGVPEINEFISNAAAFLETCRKHYVHVTRNSKVQ